MYISYKFKYLYWVIFLAAILSGCVVGVSEFFQPKGKGIDVRPRQCGQIGSANMASFFLEKVKISTHVHNGNPKILVVEIQIPEGYSLKLGDVQYKVNASTEWVKISDSEYSFNNINNEFEKEVSVLLSDTLVGHTIKRSGLLLNDINNFFILKYSFPMSLIDEVVVVFNEIVVDGKKRDVKKIIFSRKKALVALSVNC